MPARSGRLSDGPFREAHAHCLPAWFIARPFHVMSLACLLWKPAAAMKSLMHCKQVEHLLDGTQCGGFCRAGEYCPA